MVRAAGLLLTVAGCSGDPAGPSLAGDELRVPLTAAIHQAERSTNFIVFGGAGLIDLTIAQMVATGSHDRSRAEDGVPTDPVTQEHYDATAFLIAYDIITPTGFRLTGERLHILSWAGLDVNRGVAQAMMSVSAGTSDGTVMAGIFDVSSAVSFYYSGLEGRVWENSPSITVELTALARPTSPQGCRGPIPETVTCEVYAEPGRAAGTFGFFAREVGLGTSNTVFEFRPTAFDLPVTGLRIVDTLRFADGR